MLESLEGGYKRFPFSEHLHRIRLAFFSQPFPTRWERLARCGRACKIAGARNTTALGRDPIFPVIIHPMHGELPVFFYISLDINQALIFLPGSHSQPLLCAKCVVLRLQTLHSSRRHVVCPPFFSPNNVSYHFSFLTIVPFEMKTLQMFTPRKAKFAANLHYAYSHRGPHTPLAPGPINRLRSRSSSKFDRQIIFPSSLPTYTAS